MNHSKLSIVNSMLATVGLAPLSAEDIAHPAYSKADRKLDEVNFDFQNRGWWFNHAVRTLMHDPGTGEIVIPSRAMAVDPVDTSKNYVVRGHRLFDMGSQSFNIGAAVECQITENIPIEYLPPTASSYLRAEARRAYFLDEDGSAQKLDQYNREAQRAWVLFHQEHLNHADVNFFSGQSNLWYAMRGRAGRLKVR